MAYCARMQFDIKKSFIYSLEILSCPNIGEVNCTGPYGGEWLLVTLEGFNFTGNKSKVLTPDAHEGCFGVGFCKIYIFILQYIPRRGLLNIDV